jgi:hypothetical protein
MSGPSWRVAPGRVAGDRGTMIPMIIMCFLLAGTLVCASVAASAAFLAQRDLAGVCDGAAIAAASGVSRDRLGSPPVDAPDTHQDGGQDTADDGWDPDAGVLPLDADLVERALADYQSQASAAGSPVLLTAETDGQLVTVVCRRTVRIPFGALLGYRNGLERVAVAHAQSPLD